MPCMAVYNRRAWLLNTGGESCRRGFEKAQKSQRNKKCTEISKKWVIRETRPKRGHGANSEMLTSNPDKSEKGHCYLIQSSIFQFPEEALSCHISPTLSKIQPRHNLNREDVPRSRPVQIIRNYETRTRNICL